MLPFKGLEGALYFIEFGLQRQALGLQQAVLPGGRARLQSLRNDERARWRGVLCGRRAVAVVPDQFRYTAQVLRCQLAVLLAQHAAKVIGRHARDVCERATEHRLGVQDADAGVQMHRLRRQPMHLAAHRTEAFPGDRGLSVGFCIGHQQLHRQAAPPGLQKQVKPVPAAAMRERAHHLHACLCQRMVHCRQGVGKVGLKVACSVVVGHGR